MRYAQIDIESGMVVSDSYLSGELKAENMIPLSDDFDLSNKKYINGEWVDYVPEVVDEPTDQELINAEILLNQADILSNQAFMDEVLAEILLSQTGGSENV